MADFVLQHGAWHGGRRRLLERVRARGRSLNDEVPPPFQALFASLAAASGDDTVALPLEVFQGAFMDDADPATAAIVPSVLRPRPYRTFTAEPVGGNAYRDLGAPLHYAFSSEDVPLPHGDFARTPRFPHRIGATLVTAPGSHEAVFARPAELAEAPARAAGTARG